MSVDVSQMNKLSADLRGVPREVMPQVRRVVQKVCTDTKRDAQAFAPVDTGNLRSSITYETREAATSVVGEVGPTASYGAYVEFGTSRMAPHAYMGPAFDRNASAFQSAMDHIKAANLL